MEPSPLRLEIDGIPEPVCALAEALEASGYATWIVGGGLRDLLCEKPPGDFDLATAAPPEAVLSRFPRAVPIGLRFGTVMVPTPAGPVDITTLRGNDIEEDLGHRDFTVNALAWHPGRGELLDPFDGRSDLAKGRLRAVRCAADRLAEDPLRALRAVRLVATHGLEIDDELAQALGDAVPALSRVARERVRHELVTLLLAPGVATGLRLLRDGGLEARLAPAAAPDAAAVVEALPARLELRLAGWLRGARPTAILRKLRFARRTTDSVADLLRWHPVEWNVDTQRDVAVRRHLKQIGPERADDLVALRHAELRVGESAGTPRAVAGLAQLEALVAAFERVRQAGDLALRRRDLAIDGKEVMRLLGCGPGPHVGRTLAFLTHCVVEDPSRNTPETLHRLVETLAAEPKGGDKS
ncbi:MAG: hypothetical protein CL938_06455 [Deltaproteobacteria bacterium]|jgi:tRNA nucleotidyltransferase (CCA-adding enzyme)|nr:hypothetical protein [Deltaproteobacteria bacterium]MDP7074802.1 hypothetical protein [Myxococcota bacterium]MDP7570662.1 hypothetical protein [Myxococcota bacterium]